jgi:dienelactone hydrolase
LTARGLILVAALALAALSLAVLERARGGVTAEAVVVAGTPATIYRPLGATGPLPPVIVAHGFGGSRVFMDALARAVARAGFTVVSFDFDGHGRNPRPLSPDVTRIEGTTAQLVDQTLAVAGAVRGMPDVAGPLSFVGHSMATDIVVRAAGSLAADESTAAQAGGRQDGRAVGSVVVLSMYSDAVTATAPRRLLALSGQWEGRLRTVALAAARQVDPLAVERQTVRAGSVERRADVAPFVGHVGVLFSPLSLREARDWIVEGTSGAPAPTKETGLNAGGVASPVPRTGPWILVLLGSLPVGVWAAAGAMARPARGNGGFGTRLRPVRLAAAAAVSAAAGIAAALAVPGSLLGLAGFGGLAAFVAAWGLAAAVTLGGAGHHPGRNAGRSPVLALARATIALVLASAAAILSVDRYVSSFVPTGPRLGVFLCLLPACLPFGAAQAFLAVRAGLLARIAMHLGLIAALAGAMALLPGRLALSFTALPVTVLFLAMFGTMTGVVARRGGAAGMAVAAGSSALLLAWSLAASTPLFLPR